MLPTIRELMTTLTLPDPAAMAWSFDPTVRQKGFQGIAIPRFVDAFDRPTCHRCPLYYTCPAQLIGGPKQAPRAGRLRRLLLRLLRARPEEATPISYRNVVPSDACPVWYDPTQQIPRNDISVYIQQEQSLKKETIHI
jgi:hypothetical protein